MSDESRATYTLRASRDLLDRLKKAADDRSHSMNAEIIRRLEESFEPQSIQEIVAQHANLPLDLEYRRAFLEIAKEAYSNAVSIAKMTESDPKSTDLDIALSKHQVKIALKDLDRARSQAAILEGKPPSEF